MTGYLHPPFIHCGLRVGLLLGLLNAAIGCGEDFDPYIRLEGPRVLAIAAHPPAPEPGEVSGFVPLVYLPAPDPSLTYAWSWCPVAGTANDGYPCLISEAELAALSAQAGLPPPPPYDLGRGPTARLQHLISPALLAQICAGAPGTMAGLDCEGGFPVQIRLRVTTATRSIDAVRTLRLRFDPSHEPNDNPTIMGLLAEVAKDDPPVTDQAGEVVKVDRPLTSEADLVIPRHKETRIKALVSPAVSQEYTGKGNNLETTRLRERLIFTWFVESGDVDEEKTGYIDGLTPLEVATTNKWTPALARDYQPTTARLIVVIRDNRGGVSWATGAVRLGEAP